jgi:hypothetical protein
VVKVRWLGSIWMLNVIRVMAQLAYNAVLSQKLKVTKLCLD